MKLTITIELNADEKGWITCPEMRSSFPTKNATKDVAALVSEAIELAEEAQTMPVAVQYPAMPPLRQHSSHWAKERREGLLDMVNDPTASPQERFLAAAILKQP
jgi:hypothetical protein